MLIFIDTNICLDLYRTPRDSSNHVLLGRVMESKSKIISTSQVEMEFLKNRQSVLSRAASVLKGGRLKPPEVPAFLQQTRSTETIKNSVKRVNTHVDKYVSRLRGMMVAANKYDPVYRQCAKLWDDERDTNLHRGHPKTREIRRVALKRFWLGYPPRKDGDTSYGDAINWEWIVACASQAKSDVVIVSRDSDYGEGYINDWLAEEFTERVGKSCRVSLTDKLTTALKLLEVEVTPEEEAAEEELLQEREVLVNLGSDYFKVVPTLSAATGGLLGRAQAYQMGSGSDYLRTSIDYRALREFLSRFYPPESDDDDDAAGASGSDPGGAGSEDPTAE
jgi:hypothetical protein